MKKYALSKPAESDLKDIRDFIAVDNPKAAEELLVRLAEAMDHLAEFPEMGHRRREITNAHVRFWPVRDYVIVYDPKTEPLRILRVFSGWRNLGLLI